MNTRAFKKKESHYIITVGSICKEKTKKDQDYKEGIKYDIIYGEFAPYLEEMNYYLKHCLKYCANETQEAMVKDLIDHYYTGDIETHKNSQRHWVKDLSPVVESNMGWIETYVDPSGMRAYFEGWVAVVDKEKSEKFKALVTNSEKIIPMLPWPKEMEKEEFLAPDFTTLEVIAFATNGCPLGINVPNYDDIRETEGFKNVFLNNSMPSYSQSTV